jgi:hypothetical protein
MRKMNIHLTRLVFIRCQRNVIYSVKLCTTTNFTFIKSEKPFPWWLPCGFPLSSFHCSQHHGVVARLLLSFLFVSVLSGRAIAFLTVANSIHSLYLFLTLLVCYCLVSECYVLPHSVLPSPCCCSSCLFLPRSVMACVTLPFLTLSCLRAVAVVLSMPPFHAKGGAFLALLRPSEDVQKGERPTVLGILCRDLESKAYIGTCLTEEAVL